MATHQICESSVHTAMLAVMKKYYPDLIEAGVTVCCMFTHAAVDKDGNPKGPALKHHGVPSAAIIKINSLKDRVQGKEDCTMEIDGDLWPDRPEKEKNGIFHHELQHVEVQKEEDGSTKLDDANRPKIKLRPHDMEFGIFYSTIDVYGSDCIDSQHLAGAAKKWKQLDLPFPELRIAKEA